MICPQAYIGLPGEGARYKILLSCISELARSGLIQSKPCILPPSYPAAVAACEALPDFYAEVTGSDSAAGGDDDGMHGAAPDTGIAVLRLEDLNLAADVRDELATSPDHMETSSTDSLSVVKLGMHLRYASQSHLLLAHCQCAVMQNAVCCWRSRLLYACDRAVLLASFLRGTMLLFGEQQFGTKSAVTWAAMLAKRMQGDCMQV